MKKPHRRTHLIMWFALAPLMIVGGAFAWLQKPATPYTDLPEAITLTAEGND